MKCPKCGYISFDYNQVCPKCNKNIADEQSKFNIPSFRPNPPSLLGILTGEGDESNVGLQTSSSESMGASHEMDVRLDDSAVIGTSGIDFDEGHDMEDISLGHEDSGDFELSGEEEISLVDTDEISIEDTEGLIMSSDEEEGGEISLDLGDVSLEENGAEEISVPEEIIGEEGEQEISLDELSMVDYDIPEEIADEETGVGPDSIDLEIDKEAGGEERSEIELNFDDLKINETGELEIGKHLEPDKVAEEDSLDLGDLSLDDSGPVAEEDSLDLGDLSLDDSGPVAEEDSLDLGDLSLDDSGPVAEEDSLDLGDMPLEESDSEDDEKTMVYDEPLSIDKSALEAMIDESPSDISLDLSEDQGSADTTDDEMTFDLENLDLDLDLDLDEPEDKS